MSRILAAVGSAVGGGIGCLSFGYLRHKKYVIGITQNDADLYGAVFGAMIGAAIGAGSSCTPPKQVGTSGVGVGELRQEWQL